VTPEDQARQRLMQSLQREQENRQAAALKAQEKESAAPAWRRRLQRTLRSRITGILILSVIVLGGVGTFVIWFVLNTLDRLTLSRLKGGRFFHHPARLPRPVAGDAVAAVCPEAFAARRLPVSACLAVRFKVFTMRP
jgi:hypothetical protein